MGLIRWFKRRRFAKQMKKGKIPRGRTDIMGGANIKVKTKTTARHLRNGREIGRREIFNRKVTTAFVNDIVDNLITETSAFGDYKYHDSGIGTNSESASDTALQTPTGVARAAGTQVEGAETYEYKSVATITYDGSYAVTEHGVFNASSSGTLMDRTVFSAINVANNDQIEFTFTIQFSAES